MPLTKEEKRRLEKLAIDEISGARSRFINARSIVCDALVKKLNASIPAAVTARAKRITVLDKRVATLEAQHKNEVDTLETQIRKEKRWFSNSTYQYTEADSGGYYNDNTPTPAKIEVVSDHKELIAFGVVTDEESEEFSTLEKNFSIGLLDTEDAVSMFKQLQKDLAKI